MTKFFSVAITSALLSVPFAASAAVIDFDGLDASAAQSIPLAGFSEDGYTFSLASSGANAGPAIFDTTCSTYGGSDGCNGDADLQPIGGQGTDGIAGNVLILQENRASLPTPNDDVDGGEIFLTLVSGKAFRITSFSAVDDEEQFELVDKDGTVLGTVGGGVNGGTEQVSVFSSPIRSGETFSVRYGGSGGIDSLVLAPIPVPAALPLLVGAFGGLGLLGLRRRRKA